MSKETHKKLALADLMERAEQRRDGAKTYKQVYLPTLDGELVFEKISLTRVLGLLDGVDSTDMQANLDFHVQLIYDCCPMLRSQELQEAFGCKVPTDIVCALLEDNFGDISTAADAILAMYGLSDNRDSVKN